jgi:phosphoglycerol transferase MdoB-like AlkP superfamily enzyme
MLLLMLTEAFGCIAFSNFLTAFLNLSRQSTKDYLVEEHFLSSMSSYGTNLASVVFISLIMERTAATLFINFYEQQVKSVCWLLFLVVICVS